MAKRGFVAPASSHLLSSFGGTTITRKMAHHLGLLFQIFAREFMASRRRERGYGINPWKTHNLFIISHALLRDEISAAS